MQIIDMRLRPPLPSWTKTLQFNEGIRYYPMRYGFPRPPSAKARSMDLLLKEIDEAGITWGVIMGRQSAPPLGSIPNDEIAAALLKYPKKFVGFAGIDLRDIDAGIREVERTAKMQGFRGVSIEPGATFEAMYSDDKRLYPLYALCQELELPISISLSAALSAGHGYDLSYGSPASVCRVAKDFPNLKIIVSHAGWPNVESMMGVAFIQDNVYVSPDLYMNGMNMPGAHEYIKAAHFFLGDRLLFGTAYPSRPLKESVEAFMQWSLPQDLRDKILYRNAARLLKIG